MIGHDVVMIDGIPWRRTHGALFPWLPPHAEPEITEDAARRILGQCNAHFIRWDQGFGQEGDSEWWHIIKTEPTAIEALPKKVRYLVRQGLRAYQISSCQREEILAEGYSVYRQAYKRYDTFEPCFDETRFVSSVKSMPDSVEFWCARRRPDGKMVAFAENIVESDACFYSTMWFCPDALKQGVSYALIQAMNDHYLDERGLRYVSDGARNISHKTGIHDFLQAKFGFRRSYCALRVVYSRPIGSVVSILYPFRRVISNSRLLPALSALLEQERIRRACAGW